MAITTMTNRETYLADPENVRVVRDYHGAEEGITHVDGCPNFGLGRREESCVSGMRPDGTWGRMAPTSKEIGPTQLHADCVKGCYYREPLYMHTHHRGVVLDLGEVNGYQDSDFYAVVWDAEKGCPDRVTYASTRGWTYPNGATVDATPEVLAAYAAYKARRAAEAEALAQAAYEAREAFRARVEAAGANKGRQVIGSKKRTGTLFWVGVAKGGESIRAGVKYPDGQVSWHNFDKLKFVD